MRDVSHDHPLVIMSFNRPDYFRTFLESLKRQQGAELAGRAILLFQDGARNKFSSILHGRSEDVSSCVAIFNEIFPGKTVFESSDNLGVALNFDRAERYVFEDLVVEAAVFLEDDLVLSPHYINIVDHLIAVHSSDPRVGYLAAYGDHRLSLQEQKKNIHKLAALHHNWGFGLYRRQWLQMRPYVEEYLALLGDKDYQLRDHTAVARLFASWGFDAPATSQDAAKTLACCITNTIKVNTYACFAKYIGERGLHMNPDEFRRRNYARTEVINDLITEFAPITKLVFQEIRSELMDWAGKSHAAAEHVTEIQRLFLDVNRDVREGRRDKAPETAASAVSKLLADFSDNRAIHIGFYSIEELRDVDNESHVRVDIDRAALRLGCPKQMIGANFSNYFQAFGLAGRLLNGLTAATPLEGSVTMDLGNGSNVGHYSRVSFSSGLTQAALVIDPEFYYSQGYEHLKKTIQKIWLPWRERRDLAFWRGNTTGFRSAPCPSRDAPMTWTWLQRLHLCDRAKQSSHARKLDVGLTDIVQIGEPHVKSAILAANFIRGPVQEADLVGYRYILVVDGNTSVANGLLQALLAGACVLLIGSKQNYKSWFYEKLVPWETHVPVEADLSDLDGRLEWAFSHPDQCERIAYRGREATLSMSFGAEWQRSVERIRSLVQP